MKKLILALVLFCAVIAQRASAAPFDPPYFDGIRSEITNQLTLASNAPALDAKLVKALNKILTVLDKGVTNTVANTTNKLTAGTKVLGAITKALNKTSLSNVFDAPLQQVIDIYTGEYFSRLAGLSNRVENTFPGSKHDSALKALGKLLVAATTANTNMNSNLAAKALGKAATALKSADKAVAKAEAVPPPPAGVTATIAITGQSSTSFKSLQAVIVTPVAGNFVINSAQTAGSGFNTQLRSLAFNVNGLVPGVNNVNIANGEYSVAALSGGAAFVNAVGTAQLTWDPAHNSLYGTFHFVATEQGGSRTATVDGSVTGYY